jgi:type IV pilus assembly protein PilW
MKNLHLHILPSKNHRSSGFTLVELMVVVAVSMLIISGVSWMYTNMRNATTAQEQVVEMQQNIRVALNIIENDVRMAGFDPLGNDPPITGIIPPAANPPTNTYANSLNFTMVMDVWGRDGIDNDGDALIDEQDEIGKDGIDNDNVLGIDQLDEFETVEYYVYDSAPAGDGRTALGRRTSVPLSGLQPVAEDIDAVEFNYVLDDGTQTTAPTAAQLPDIRAVEISILARADRADSDYTYNERSAANVLLPYIPGSGNLNWDINGPGQPFPAPCTPTDNPPTCDAQSHIRRRLLITTVQCRNIGL